MGSDASGSTARLDRPYAPGFPHLFLNSARLSGRARWPTYLAVGILAATAYAAVLAFEGTLPQRLGIIH